MQGSGHYRLRTRLRRRLPWFLLDLGFAATGRRDCCDDEWYNADGMTARCYHCTSGKASWRAVRDSLAPR